MVIVEAAVAIAARRSVGACELSILVARTPFWFVARLPLARSFAAIAMTFVRRVASRNELRLRFIGFTVAKPILSIAMTRALLALAGPGAPLSLVGFVVAMPGRPITILFDHAVIVVLRTLAARFVRGGSCWRRASRSRNSSLLRRAERSADRSSASDDDEVSSSSASVGSMTELSHSPTDMPERRAASRAAARASGRRPLKFHGPPDFILTSKSPAEQELLAHSS